MMKHLHQSGAAMLMFVIFFALSATSLLVALGSSIFFDLRDYGQLAQAKQTFYTAESLLEDVTYRNVFGMTVGTTESLTLASVTASATTTYNSTSDYYQIDVRGRSQNITRKAQAILTVGAGSAFSYGLQSGTGGITLTNNSTITGNVYSNGRVTGAGSAEVRGDIVSAGPSGYVQTITATGTIRANTINRITAGKDAYYNVQVGTNAQNPVAGTRYTPAANQPLVPLPISTTTIQEWKDSITTTITASDPLCSSGTYTINTNITIGYLRVQCNLEIRKSGGSTTVTVNGPVWVEGNINFSQGPVIQVDPSLGRRSVQFIADKPTDRLTSSKISINQSTQFNGSGDYRSFVMLLSANESAKLGGTEKAINVAQSANGSLIVYTNDGLVDIGNNISLKEVTGYKINVSNGSNITYSSGLASLLFTSGPGGGYTINDWQQIQ